MARKHRPPLRFDNDKPLPAHAEDWVTSIARPEGITAVVG